MSVRRKDESDSAEKESSDTSPKKLRRDSFTIMYTICRVLLRYKCNKTAGFITTSKARRSATHNKQQKNNFINSKSAQYEYSASLIISMAPQLKLIFFAVLDVSRNDGP